MHRPWVLLPCIAWHAGSARARFCPRLPWQPRTAIRWLRAARPWHLTRPAILHAAPGAVADRVASERGEQTGENVGYTIRLESRGGPSSSLMFCTNGVLLRMLTGVAREPLAHVTHLVGGHGGRCVLGGVAGAATGGMASCWAAAAGRAVWTCVHASARARSAHPARHLSSGGGWTLLHPGVALLLPYAASVLPAKATSAACPSCRNPGHSGPPLPASSAA